MEYTFEGEDWRLVDASAAEYLRRLDAMLPWTDFGLPRPLAARYGLCMEAVWAMALGVDWRAHIRSWPLGPDGGADLRLFGRRVWIRLNGNPWGDLYVSSLEPLRADYLALGVPVGGRIVPGVSEPRTVRTGGWVRRAEFERRRHAPTWNPRMKRGEWIHCLRQDELEQEAGVLRPTMLMEAAGGEDWLAGLVAPGEGRA